LSDTDSVNFSLNNLLDFDPIKNFFNRMILDITFKFFAELNVRLIFDYFYALKKKHQLTKSIKTTMCRLNTPIYDLVILYFCINT
jgi:hypothetical protein